MRFHRRWSLSQLGLNARVMPAVVVVVAGLTVITAFESRDRQRRAVAGAWTGF